MSSGVALSTPREHLNNIEMTIKATGLFAATARIGFGAAAKAYPLGSLLKILMVKYRRFGGQVYIAGLVVKYRSSIGQVSVKYRRHIGDIRQHIGDQVPLK